jgi:hypothetical protein
LREDPSFVDEAKIVQTKILFLIENNPELAKEVMMRIAEKRPLLLKARVAADVSAPSVSVAHKVLLSKKAPDWFLDEYIEHAATALADIRDNTTFARKAKMFCPMIGLVFQQNGLQPTLQMSLNLHSVIKDDRVKSLKEVTEWEPLLLRGP